ncbi:MAG: chemotaxis protein CheB, partial [Pseudomonadota bacterium]
IMTGMGSDGAEGHAAMREAGALTFGQDEASSVVYGMPREAMRRGAVVAERPLGELAEAVLAHCAARTD